MYLLDHKSPAYVVAHYRNMGDEPESVLDNFLDWLKHDAYSPALTPDEFEQIKSLVDKYLCRDSIKEAEQSLLDQWTAAVNLRA